jgi:hypothetical protein
LQVLDSGGAVVDSASYFTSVSAQPGSLGLGSLTSSLLSASGGAVEVAKTADLLVRRVEDTGWGGGGGVSEGRPTS